MKTQDVVCGSVLVGISLVLYTQTGSSGEENYFASEFDPMQYPRALVYLLGAMGALLGVKGMVADRQMSDMPIFSRRTVGVSATLICYALLFQTLGFFITSVLACFGGACIMGYRRRGFLALFCLAAAVLIWLVYLYVLRIPLPTGTIF